MKVEHFANSSPSTCLPPNCGGNMTTDSFNDPTRARINSMSMYNNIIPTTTSGSPQHFVDDLYTTNSFGMPSADNGRNANQDANLYTQKFDKYHNKIYVNCPNTVNDNATGACTDGNADVNNADVNNDATIPLHRDIDGNPGLTSVTTYGEVSGVVGTSAVAPIWLQDSPAPREFGDSKQCKDWCNDNGACKGVQTFYHNAEGDGIPKLHCNYYNDQVNLKVANTHSTLQDYTGYDTFIKKGHSYSGNPTKFTKKEGVKHIPCPDSFKPNSDGTKCEKGSWTCIADPNNGDVNNLTTSSAVSENKCNYNYKPNTKYNYHYNNYRCSTLLAGDTNCNAGAYITGPTTPNTTADTAKVWCDENPSCGGVLDTNNEANEDDLKYYSVETNLNSNLVAISAANDTYIKNNVVDDTDTNREEIITDLTTLFGMKGPNGGVGIFENFNNNKEHCGIVVLLLIVLFAIACVSGKFN
jgi:hypothetical protein